MVKCITEGCEKAAEAGGECTDCYNKGYDDKQTDRDNKDKKCKVCHKTKPADKFEARRNTCRVCQSKEALKKYHDKRTISLECSTVMEFVIPPIPKFIKLKNGTRFETSKLSAAVLKQIGEEWAKQLVEGAKG